MDHPLLYLTGRRIERPCRALLNGSGLFESDSHPGRLQRLGRGWISRGRGQVSRLTLWGVSILNQASVIDKLVDNLIVFLDLLFSDEIQGVAFIFVLICKFPQRILETAQEPA